MTEREAALKAALVSHAAIRVQAEQLIAAYVALCWAWLSRPRQPQSSPDTDQGVCHLAIAVDQDWSAAANRSSR